VWRGQACRGVWEVGVWEVGVWVVGVWEVGVWEVGVWVVGVWVVGVWELGVWVVGVWEVGVWEAGVWEVGVWEVVYGWREVGEIEESYATFCSREVDTYSSCRKTSLLHRHLNVVQLMGVKTPYMRVDGACRSKLSFVFFKTALF